MALTTPPQCDFGRPAPDFALPGTDGQLHTRDGCRGPNGLLVMFICNHCPYVKAILDRLLRDAAELQSLGIGVVAISSNDAATYPEDAFPEMARIAAERAFSFPYLHDETQAVARAYGAVCTPDFFGFDAGLGLQYRGRLDDTGIGPARPDARRELVEAMRRVAAGEGGPREQTASIGCSLKWKNEG